MSETKSTYPYPERGSSFAEKILLPESLPLTPEQRQEIYSFEDPFYNSLKEIKLISKDIKKKTTYPEVETQTEKKAKEVFIDTFKREFLEGKGNIENIPNPRREVKLSDSSKLFEELKSLRELKKQLKESANRAKEEEPDPNLQEAKLIVLDLYRRYVNLQIAERYEYGAVLSNQKERTAVEENIVELLQPAAEDFTEKGRFAPNNAARTLQRIDRFIYGTGMQVDEAGKVHLDSLSEELEAYAQLKLNKPESEKDDDFRVNADQQARIVKMLLENSGIQNCGVEIEEGRTRMDIKPSREKGDVVLIGGAFNRSPASAIKGASMELVHFLRIEGRRQVFAGKLRLYDKYAGRYSVLMAAAEEYVAGRATEVFGDEHWEAKPYIYAIIERRSKGASFREGYLAGVESRAKKMGKNVKEYLASAKDSTLELNFNNTLSVWGRNTDLEEYSDKVTHTGELSYLEGELLAGKLEGTELWPLLFLSGPDLYTICDLKRLGIIEPEKINQLDMKFIDKIVIPFKEELDKKRRSDLTKEEKEKAVDEAITFIEESLKA